MYSHTFLQLYSTRKPRMNKEKNKTLFSVGLYIILFAHLHAFNTQQEPSHSPSKRTHSPK